MFCYDCSCNIRFIFTNTKLHIFRIPKNQNIPNTPLTCLNFSFSIRSFQLELFATEGRKKPVNSSIVDLTPRHKNTRLVSSGASLTSWGEGASLALIGHPSSDGVTIKILYGVDGVDVAPHLFLLGWLTLVVAVITVDAYPFLAFSDLTCLLEDTGIDVFWLH